MTEPSFRLAGALALAAALLLFPTNDARSSDDPRPDGLAIAVGTLHVGDGEVRRDVVVVTDGARIAAIEPAAEFPAERVTHRFADATATPGWIDAATHLGLDGGAVEIVEILTPDARAVDAWSPTGTTYEGLLASGVTTLGLVPQAGNLIPGRAGAIGLTTEDTPTVVERVGPTVFAVGGGALRQDRVPSTLAGARAVLTEAFEGRVWSTTAEADPPIRDDALEALTSMRDAPVLARVDDAVGAELLAEVLATRELRPTFVGLRSVDGDEDRIAALGAACVVTGLSPVDPVRRLSIPGRLVERGVAVSLSTGAPDRSPGSFRMALALAVAHGLPTDHAVRAVTSSPATALGVQERVGRVQPGLEADLVLFSGAPWELTSRTLLVVADGEVAFEVEEQE